MFFALVFTAASVLGGWKEVKPSSKFVQRVQPYLKENYLKLLPEYKQRNTLLVIESAEIQIVNGYNIHIVAKLGFDSVDFTLHVAPSQAISLNSFSVAPSNDPQSTGMGGWRVQEPDYEPQFVNQLISNYRNTNGLTAEPTKVLFVRTKVVSGIIVHVVYRDANGKIHSVQTYRPPSGKLEIQSADSF